MVLTKKFRIALSSLIAISFSLTGLPAQAADATPAAATILESTSATVADTVVDSQGNVITATAFSGTLTLNSVTYTSANGYAILVTKFTPALTPLWSKFIDSQAFSATLNLRILPTDEVIVGSLFGVSTLTIDGLSVTKIGNTADGFTTKLSATGVAQWLKGFGSAGSTSYNGAGGLAAGTDGAVYSRIRFGDVTAAATSLAPFSFTPTGTGPAWVVVKQSQSGAVVWAKQLPSGFISSYPLDVNGAGEVIVGGYINAPVTFPTQGTFTPVLADGIMMQLTSSGSDYKTIKIAGGSGNSRFNSLTYLPDGSIAGALHFSGDVVINGVTYNAQSASNLLVAKMSGAALTTDWANAYPGTGSVNLTHIAASPAGALYVALWSNGQVGFTSSTSGIQSIVAFDNSGQLDWVRSWEAPTFSFAWRIAVNDSNLFTGGQIDANTNFGNGINLSRSVTSTGSGGTDGFVLRMALPRVLPPAPPFTISGVSPVSSGQTLTLSIKGNSLDNVSRVSVGGTLAEIVSKNSESMVVTAKGLVDGYKTLSLSSGTYKVDIENAVLVKNPAERSKNLLLAKSRISSSQSAQLQNLVAQFKTVDLITCTAGSKALAIVACKAAKAQRPSLAMKISVETGRTPANKVVVSATGQLR